MTVSSGSTARSLAEVLVAAAAQQVDDLLPPFAGRLTGQQRALAVVEDRRVRERRSQGQFVQMFGDVGAFLFLAAPPRRQ